MTGRYSCARGVDGFEIQDTSYPHPLGGRLVMNLAISSEWVAQDYAEYLNRCDAAGDVEPLGFLPWCGIWSSYHLNHDDGGSMPDDNMKDQPIRHTQKALDALAVALTGLQEKSNPMEPSRALAIRDVAHEIIYAEKDLKA